jgi:hypothetical protein
VVLSTLNEKTSERWTIVLYPHGHKLSFPESKKALSDRGYDIKSAMKKILLIGCFIIMTACQPATLAPTPTPIATATRPVPTPIPATATVTFTPSPTFTPEPPPRYFTEEFDSAPVHWSTLLASGDANQVETLNQNSKLTFELYSSNAWLYAIYGAQEYDIVHIEARIESAGSDANYMGLICNYSEQAGWFEFNISSDGSYTILRGQWLGEGIASYMPVAEGGSEYINEGNNANEMGLDCLGDKLQLYINGKLFRSIDVSRFEMDGGRVGLAVASFEEVPVILAFDWVKVDVISTSR